MKGKRGWGYKSGGKKGKKGMREPNGRMKMGREESGVDTSEGWGEEEDGARLIS